MNEHSTPQAHPPLFLIGFMCSGKTRVGRELAHVLGRRHLDLDRVIEARTGPLVPFFQQHGEEAFRILEAEVLQDLLKEQDAVISTGGGTPCMGNNLEVMKSAGTVVWLDVPFDELMRRIERAGGDRPLLFGLHGEALRARVEELMADREEAYRQAHLIVQAGAAPDHVALQLKRVLDLQAR
jgi:shikimate kinase